MPRRRPANCAGSPAFLAPNGRFRTRSLRSLRHPEPDFPVRCCDTRRHRGRWGGRRKLGGCRSVSSARNEPAPTVAAAEHCRAGRKKGRRMSERRERSERSEFGGPRPDRNAQGTGPEAAPAAVGPAASPGSVSWLLLGAPRSNSHQPAKLAAKRLLILICESRATTISRRRNGF